MTGQSAGSSFQREEPGVSALRSSAGRNRNVIVGGARALTETARQENVNEPLTFTFFLALPSPRT